MPLTPQDVKDKQFTVVRMTSKGYDMGEVDTFLDEVEAELSRLHQENEELRRRAGGAPAQAPAAEQATAPTDELADKSADKPADQPDKAADEPGGQPVASVAAPAESGTHLEELRVTTAPEASAAATRLLELATRNHDELIGQARSEADSILTGARTEAEKLQAQARQSAERQEAEARERAKRLESETQARRQELLSGLQQEKQRLDGEVGSLRAFEREYRSRLRSYFTQQLAVLDGEEGTTGEGASSSAGGPEHQPGRLKAILGDAGRSGGAEQTPPSGGSSGGSTGGPTQNG